ncbi:MAG TPA: hypothetical protein PKV72_00715 [Candidatus Peribacteria bacterium]|nr:hypothetical protein [Candidatus Peribacteria bacterium]
MQQQQPFLLNFLVPRRDLHAPEIGFLRTVAATIAIYSMIVPLVLLDLWTRAYHAVYFPLCGLPTVPREQYVIVDRGNLKGLKWGQRISCAYCDYANGVLAWVRAVAGITEAYSCAIKHPSGHRHQPDDLFYDHTDFVTPPPSGK